MVPKPVGCWDAEFSTPWFARLIKASSILVIRAKFTCWNWFGSLGSHPLMVYVKCSELCWCNVKNRSWWSFVPWITSKQNQSVLILLLSVSWVFAWGKMNWNELGSRRISWFDVVVCSCRRNCAREVMWWACCCCCGFSRAQSHVIQTRINSRHFTRALLVPALKSTGFACSYHPINWPRRHWNTSLTNDFVKRSPNCSFVSTFCTSILEFRWDRNHTRLCSSGVIWEQFGGLSTSACMKEELRAWARMCWVGLLCAKHWQPWKGACSREKTKGVWPWHVPAWSGFVRDRNLADALGCCRLAWRTRSSISGSSKKMSSVSPSEQVTSQERLSMSIEVISPSNQPLHRLCVQH